MNKPRTTFLILLGASICILFLFPFQVHAENVPEVKRGENLSFTIQLLENGTFGDPIESEPVEFFDQTNNWLVGIEHTNQNGYATFQMNLAIDYPLGDTIFNATYRGNETRALYPSCQWMMVAIVSKTQLQATLTEDSMIYGDDIAISGYLTDDIGNPITNAEVTIIGNNKTLQTIISDHQGILSSTIQTNNSWAQLGKNSFSLSYQGNSEKYYSEAETHVEFELIRTPTNISTNMPVQESVHLNETIEAEFVLHDETDTLANECISITLDEAIYTYVWTNETGGGKFLIEIDDEYSMGKYQLIMEYNGTTRHQPCSIEILLSVLSNTYITHNINSSSFVEINTVLDIEVLITDIFKRPIEGITVQIFDTTTTQNSTLNLTGIGIRFIGLLCIQPPKGTHHLAINITGNEFLINKSLFTKITVWSRPLLILTDSNIMNYASLGQEIEYTINISDYQGHPIKRNLSAFLISLDVSSNQTISVSNSSEGKIVFIAPMREGRYTVTILYFGNEARKELVSSLTVSFTVSSAIPSTVILKSYTQSSITGHIVVEILLWVKNGSREKDIEISYWWLQSKQQSVESVNGVAHLYLTPPPEAGAYNLIYEIEPGRGIMSSTGSFRLIISSLEVNSASGLGFIPLISALSLSCLILIIPIIKKHYFVS